jgi:Tfp pilus assembly protein PilN
MIFQKQRILAIEVAGDIIRAVLLERRGKKTCVVDFTSLKRPSSEEDLPDVETMKKLAQKLEYTRGKAVYVTALARACELYMDKKKVSGMNLYQLSEAAKWEIEPYTGISGNNALVGVEKEKKPRAKPGEIVYEDETDEILVNISAIERNVYVAIKERFRAAGLKLVRIYPPEVSFYMPLLLKDLDTPRAILEIGQDYSNFAILRGKHPDQINTLNFSLDSIKTHLENEGESRDLEESLRFTFSQAPEHESVILTGLGVAVPEIIEYVNRFAASGVTPLLISKTSQVTSKNPDPADAAFGTAAGAGIRELKDKSFKNVGIDDLDPLYIRIKKNAYIMPLAATGMIAIGLLGHNQYMKYQERQFKAEIKKYSVELKKNKAKIQKYETLLEESDKINEDIKNTKNKITFVEKESDKTLVNLITYFTTFASDLPGEVVLDSICQNEDKINIFLIKGRSYELNPIGEFATSLQRYWWCDAAVIKELKKADQGEKLYFEMSIETLGTQDLNK